VRAPAGQDEGDAGSKLWWDFDVARSFADRLACVGVVVAVVGLITGCGHSNRIRVQGYVEGEFVYLSAPMAGPLQTLNVSRGAQVKAGDPLFTVDDTVQKAALDQAQASLTFSEKDFKRQEELSLTPGSASIRDLQLARSAWDQDIQRVAQAEWNYDQMHQVAPKTGVVFDTLYREGEWVDAGHPVVELLPPEDIEVRAFVPETALGTLHHGDTVRVFVDGVSEPYAGTLAFIFPQTEYTPPVIYSEESRSKLVTMVEVTFPPETAVKLNPGQPVDVEFGP
jgi:HlyD family secretion protein